MTSWYDDGDDLAPVQKAPAMPMSSRLAANRERGPGDQLALAAARSAATEARERRAEADGVRDPDEIAAAMITRGVQPGMISDLARRLGDAEADLESEREKLARSAKRQQRITRDHAAGRITAFDISRMQDLDEGDAHRAEQLERRAESLQRQLAEAQAAMAPPQERVTGGVEAASRRAHDTFVRTTQAMMAEAQAGRPVVRPFASRGGFAVRGEPVTCPECLEVGATPDESFLLHSDPHPVPADVVADMAEYDQLTWQAGGPEAGRGYSHGTTPMIYR